ncbi:sulfotransferase family protein [Sinimarinibacterium flocculans]|uniref:sulfotransferase family protein n=1 Tax=Sinimarinibacterium flocculans TaxID=985250 RepID=UPI00248FB631|nr:sulfotransferase [Sinimarinibacterium flocculans]
MTTGEAAAAPSTRLRSDALMEAARSVTGLHDFGDGDFRTGLDLLLEEAQGSGLNATGVEALQGMALGALINRLRFHEDLRRHPEILDEQIEPPFVIVGLPRSGTTKLHRMVAVDPRLQSLCAWQIMNPAPFPGGVDAGGCDPRIAAARQVDEMLHAMCPDLLAGHPMQAEEVDEESSFLMEMTFDWILTAMRWDTPRYQAWVESRSPLPVYRHLRRMLQYLQWQNPERRGRPYVLKSPVHPPYLDVLLDVFPGATVVHMHREPRESVASFMRLAELPRRLHYDDIDLRALGSWVLELLGSQTRRNLSLRDAIGARATIVDLAFRDVVSSPLDAIGQAYAARGWMLPQEVGATMLDWERRHPADRFGKFRYDLRDYGVAPGQIDEVFAEYRQRFGHLL